MATVVKWRTAFKEIYGRTPTKNDYTLAPQHVKEERFEECPPSPCAVEEPAPPRKGGVRLKRPNLDAEENCPLKQRPAKSRKLCADTTRACRTSPRKKLTAPQNICNLSPVKSCMSPVKRRVPRVPHQCPLPGSSAIASLAQLPKSPLKRIAALPAFSSLFDTPEKGQTAAWGEISPKKAVPTAPEMTSILSPRKPFVHKEVLIKHAECLLLPTPEKRERVEEVMEPFLPEDVPKKNPTAGVPAKGLAVAFCAETGKVVKRAFKRPVAAGGTTRTKKEKGNFVKINMKKKSYTKGKVSAEQKRKMRKKQNWKKRFGGGPR